MRFFSFAAVAFALAGALLAPASADVATETAAVKSLFESAKIDPAAFTSTFVQAEPLDIVQGFINSYKQRLGTPTAYDFDGFQFRIKSPKGSIGCSIALDQAGKISNLLFHDELSASNLAALQRLLSAPKADPAWFDAAPGQVAKTDKVDEVTGNLRSKFGNFVRIETRKKGYYVVYDHGEAHAQISTTADGKIYHLEFAEDAPAAASPKPTVMR
jgi:hypothetical protein